MVKRAFRNPKVLASVLKAPEDLVVGAKTIFELLNQKEFVSADMFKSHCDKMLDSFHGNKDYNWHRPSPTVHLILHHGHMFLRYFRVPPGYLNEEGAEADNKELRYVRAHHSRQTSPKAQLEDVINRSHNLANPEIQRHLPFPKVVMNEPRPHLEPFLAPKPILDLVDLNCPEVEPTAFGEPMELD